MGKESKKEWIYVYVKKIVLDSHRFGTVKTELDTYFDWYFKASETYQESKIASLKYTFLKLTEANKTLKKDQ